MAAFEKFFESASQALSRAGQYANELRGASAKTPYPDDIARDYDTAERLKKVCERMQSGVTAWLNPNPADRMQDLILEKFDAKKQPKLTAAELLGKLEQDLAGELAQVSPGDNLSIMLSQYGQTQADIGGAERNLINEIQKTFLAACKYYLETVWPTINTQHRNLELARLDFDSARQKKDACTSQDKIRPLLTQFETAQAKYNEQIETARQVFGQVKSVEDSLREGLKSMAVAQMRYYNTCQEQLRQLTGKWDTSSLH